MNLESISINISNHLMGLAEQTGRILGALAGALLILVVGLYLSRFAGSYIKKVFEVLRNFFQKKFLRTSKTLNKNN